MGNRNAFTYTASSSGRFLPDGLYEGDLESFTRTTYTADTGGATGNTYIRERGFAGGVTTATVKENGYISRNDSAASGFTTGEYSVLSSGDTINQFTSFVRRNSIKDTGGVTTITDSTSQAETTDTYNGTGFSYTRKNKTESAIQSGGVDLASNSGTTESDFFRYVVSRENNQVGNVYDSRLVESGASGSSKTYITYLINPTTFESGLEQTQYKSEEYLFSQVQSAGGHANTYVFSKDLISVDVTSDDKTAIWTSATSEGNIRQTNTIGGTTWAQYIYYENFSTTYETTYGNATASPVSQSDGESGFSSTKDIGEGNSLPPINGVPSWITIQSTSGGSGGGSSNVLTVTIADNTGTEDRTGFVVFGGVTSPATTEEIEENDGFTTFQRYLGASTYEATTTGLTQQYKLQQTTTTARSTIGNFFNEEVTQRYTSITSANTISQNIEKLITSTSARESWNDRRGFVLLSFNYITDSTLSAVGGVLGFVPNQKLPLSGTESREGAISNAQSYYYHDGELISLDDYSFSSTHGTGDIPTVEYSRRNDLETVSTQVDYIDDDNDISEEYSYWAAAGNQSSRYRSHGFLGSTYNTRSITTNSVNITWGSTGTKTTTFLSTPTAPSTYEGLASPILTRTDSVVTSSFEQLDTYLGESSTHTIKLSNYDESSYYTTWTESVATQGGSNISWEGIIRLPNKTAFDAVYLAYNFAYANTYQSQFLRGAGGIAFATETNTNRKSRDNLSPPRIKYTEWYLATTQVSTDVTIYTKSTRTGESWYIPDVSETSRLNSLIYFPENTNVEIVDNRNNAMSFDQNGKITQIVGATLTWTTDSDNLTRSTTSNFLKILETQGGLEAMTRPKSTTGAGAAMGTNGTVFGGNSEYDEGGAIYLHGGCTITAYDADGGSTLLSNSDASRVTSTLAKGKGMLSLAATENYLASADSRKNNYFVTGIASPSRTFD